MCAHCNAHKLISLVMATKHGHAQQVKLTAFLSSSSMDTQPNSSDDSTGDSVPPTAKKAKHHDTDLTKPGRTSSRGSTRSGRGKPRYVLCSPP